MFFFLDHPVQLALTARSVDTKTWDTKTQLAQNSRKHTHDVHKLHRNIRARLPDTEAIFYFTNDEIFNVHNINNRITFYS